MCTSRQAIVVTILVLSIGACSFAIAFRPSRPAPNVALRFSGYVISSGLAVFTGSNASPFDIVYSGQNLGASLGLCLVPRDACTDERRDYAEPC